MSPVIARALRRAALAGGALAATLIGHLVTVGDVRILPAAPLIWLTAIALAILPGAGLRGVAAFRAWSPPALFAALLGAQAALHALLHTAPWALGLGSHHHDTALISADAVAVHLAVAGILLWALCAGQRLLVRALAIVRAILGAEPPRASARPTGEPVWTLVVAPRQWRRGPRSSRGPPPAGPHLAGPPRALLSH